MGFPHSERCVDEPTLLIDGEASDLPEALGMGTANQVAHGHQRRAEIVLGQDTDPLARLLETERTDEPRDGR